MYAEVSIQDYPYQELGFRTNVFSMCLCDSDIDCLSEPPHEISNNVVCATSKGSDQPAHMCSLIRSFAGCLIIL